jgi:hypothetical protein
MGTLVLNCLLGVSVERKADSIVAGQSQQTREEVVVTVGADQNVGIKTLQQVQHAKNKLTPAAAGKAIALPFDLYEQVSWVASVRMGGDRTARIFQLSIQPERHDSQGRELVVNLPRAVERLDALEASLRLVDGTVCEREDLAIQNIPLRQRNVGVVVGEVWECLADLLEQSRELSGYADPHFQHLNLAIQEQIEALRKT